MEGALRRFLHDAQKIAILTIGNILRGDDAAGILVGKKIMNKINADVYIAETAPESYIVKLIDKQYSHVIIIDAAFSTERKPGEIFIVDPEKLSEGLITSHSIPVTLITEILRLHGIRSIIIGITPKNTELTEGISKEVKDAVDKLAEILIKTIPKNNTYQSLKFLPPLLWGANINQKKDSIMDDEPQNH